MIRPLTQKLQNRDRAAFTLMEMLVVVAIIVVLAGAGIPIYLNYLDNAKRDVAKSGVKQIETAVTAYKMRYQQYPQDLVSLTQPSPIDGAAPMLPPAALVDPWGRAY
jgi:general secretion pathway protein G